MSSFPRDQLLALISNGVVVGYGCGCPGVPTQLLTNAAQVPPQSQIDADNATCLSYMASPSATIAQVNQIVNNASDRAITQSIPVAIMTMDYTALPDDQRICFTGSSSGTLTPQPARLVQDRRFSFDNAGTGNLTIAGMFISPNSTGIGSSSRVTNYTLIPGASCDLIVDFIPNEPGGNDIAPSDLRIDGQAAPPGTVGAWMYSIISRNMGGPSETDFLAQQATVNQLQAAVMSFTPGTAKNAPVTKTAAYSAVALDSLVQANTASGTFAVTLPNSGPNLNVIQVEWIAGSAAPTVAYASGASLNAGQAGEAVFSTVGTTLAFQFDGTSTYTIV